MERRKKNLLVIALIPAFLFSCNQVEPSSTTEITITPVYPYDCYNREGSLSLLFQTHVNLGVVESFEYTFDSPVSFKYEADEKRAYGNNLVFEIMPFDLEENDETLKLEQANRNREVLGGIYAAAKSASTSYIDSYTTDIVADRYADEFSSSADIPDEKMSVNIINGHGYILDTINEDGTDMLTHFGTFETDNGMSNIDLSSLKINIPALLEYLASSFVMSKDTRVLMATLGTVINFLSQYLVVDIEAVSTDESIVTMTIDDRGRSELATMLFTTMLDQGLGSYIALLLEDLTLSDLSLRISLYNDNILRNQIDSLAFSVGLSSTYLSTELDLSVDLSREATSISPTYFDEEYEKRSLYVDTYEEARPFFEAVKDYVPFDDVLADGSVLASAVDLTLESGQNLLSAAESYSSLSDEAKYLLGTDFSSWSDSFALANYLRTEYQNGLNALSEANERYTSSRVVSDYNYQYIYGTASAYKNWRLAMGEQGYNQALSALDTYVNGRIDEASALLSTLETDISAFNSSPSMDNLDSAYSTLTNLNSEINISENYLSDDMKSRIEGISNECESLLVPARESVYSFISPTLLEGSFDDLLSLGENEAISSYSFFDRNHLSNEQRINIDSRLTEKYKEICSALIGSATSATELTRQYLSLRLSDIADLEQVENIFTGETRYRSKVDSFYASLLEAL